MSTLIGCRARGALRIIMMAGVLANVAAAQDTALVMLHGFNSDGGTWANAASFLRDRLQVTAVRPSLNWVRSEAEQADSLARFLNTNALTSNPARRMPFVAHSNGGLVSREYSRLGGRLSNLVTVATPHRGVFLANAFLAGMVTDYMGYLLNTLYNPIGYYGTHDPAIPSVLQLAFQQGDLMIDWTAAMLWNVCANAAACRLATGELAPVVIDLAEQSQATQTLNTGSNLDREAQAIAGRVGLWTLLHPQNAHFRMLTPDDADTWIVIRELAILGYFYAYDHYRYHEDFAFQYNSDLWLLGIYAMVDMDADWQLLTGNLITYMRGFDEYNGIIYTTLEAQWSDGLVSYLSAEYPGGFSERVLGNIAHVRQTGSAEVASKVRDHLAGFGIPPREYPPPTPSNVVNMHGPSAMRPGNSCYWNASTDMASPSFEWSVNGAVAGSGPDFYFTAYSNFTLSVRAYNSQGLNSTDTRSISVSSGNMDCPL